MSQRLSRFLGDTPLRVAIRLVVLSFLVGLVLSALNIRPAQIWYWVERSLGRIYAMGFDFVREAFDYLLIGALIVVPVFLIMRLLKSGGSGGRGRTE
jgi:nitric oxide reductase large subunit